MKCRWLIIIVLLSMSSAFAQTPMHSSDIAAVENYLNGISTFVARFEQTPEVGEGSTGTFYLSRPGRLRWEYDPPHPILILASGSLLTYHDKQLEQTSHIPIGDNLGGFLTRESISFSEGVMLVSAYVDSEEFILDLTQQDKPEDGQLTLVFNAQEIALKRMIVLDAVGRKTQVEFDQISYGDTLEKSLFILPKNWDKK